MRSMLRAVAFFQAIRHGGTFFFPGSLLLSLGPLQPVRRYADRERSGLLERNPPNRPLVPAGSPALRQREQLRSLRCAPPSLTVLDVGILRGGDFGSARVGRVARPLHLRPRWALISPINHEHVRFRSVAPAASSRPFVDDPALRSLGFREHARPGVSSATRSFPPAGRCPLGRRLGARQSLRATRAFGGPVGFKCTRFVSRVRPTWSGPFK